MKNTTLVLKLIISSTLVFLLACSSSSELGQEDADTGGGSGDTGNTNPGPNGNNDVPPSQNYLWVHHKSNKGSLRYTHKAVTSGPWTEKCRVNLDATNPAERDILCITESTELDLMHIGLGIGYNVPPHIKCPYVITSAPYFFRYEPPRPDLTSDKPRLEPVYVEVTEDRKEGTYTAQAYYTGRSDPNQPPDSSLINPYFETFRGGYRCAFDYSDRKGPNCCEGKYIERYTVIIPEFDSNGDLVGKPMTTHSEKSWGGERGNCLAGPALQLFPSPDGKFPRAKVWLLGQQVEVKNHFSTDRLFALESPLTWIKSLEARNLELKSVLDEPTSKDNNFGMMELKGMWDDQYFSTRHIANYHADLVPRAFSDILSYFDRGQPTGYPWKANYANPRYYTIMCADRGYEITARIRLMVREWNSYEALAKATEPTSGEDNESGDEVEFPQFPIHDFSDWQDEGDEWMDATVDKYGNSSPVNRINPVPDPQTYPGNFL